MNNQRANQIEEEAQPKQNNSPEMCVGCFAFFGNPQNENLCSSCYRQKLNEEKEAVKVENLVQCPPTKIEEEVKVEEPVAKQQDLSKCWKCQRKVGMGGFQCKCEYTFCKLHRLPEEHECNFDFMTRDREKLKLANPVVAASKVEKI